MHIMLKTMALSLPWNQRSENGVLCPCYDWAFFPIPVKLSGDVNNDPDDLGSDFDTFRFLVGGLEDLFFIISIYIYIWNNHPNWLIFFRGWNHKPDSDDDDFRWLLQHGHGLAQWVARFLVDFAQYGFAIWIGSRGPSGSGGVQLKP